MRMPFGKHGGKEIEDIETSYLEWLVEGKENGRLKDLRHWPGLRTEAEAELRRRRTGQQRKSQSPPPKREPSPPPPPPQDRRKEVETVVKRCFAALAMKYHADRGGSDVQMRIVNEAQSQILDTLRAESLIN